MEMLSATLSPAGPRKGLGGERGGERESIMRLYIDQNNGRLNRLLMIKESLKNTRNRMFGGVPEKEDNLKGKAIPGIHLEALHQQGVEFEDTLQALEQIAETLAGL